MAMQTISWSRLLTIATCLALLIPSLTAQFTTYNKSYGGPGNEVGGGIIAAPDGGCLAVGSTSSYGPNASEQTPNGHVLRVDGNGEVLWRRSYGGQAHDYLQDVAKLPNGEYLAVGNYDFQGTPNTAQVWLSRMDDDGTLVWNKRLGSSSHLEQGRLILAMENGDCLIAGMRQQSAGSSNGNILLIRVNMDGEPIWTAEFGTNVRESPTAILQLEGGDILIAGIRYVIPQSQGFLMKVAADGTLLWDRSYVGTGPGIGISSLVAAGSNEYIAAMARGLVGLDGAGNILWSLGYAGPDGGAFNISDIQPAGDGRFLALATLNNQALTEWSMAAMMVNGTGEQLAAMQYAHDQANGFANAAMVHQDGGFILMGRLAEQGFDINLVRTWAEGEGLEAGCHAQNLVLETFDIPEFTYSSPYTQLPSPQLVLSTMGLPPQDAGNEVTFCSNVGLPPAPHGGALALYPVPASEVLHLGDALPVGPIQVEVFDAAGRSVMLHENQLERALDVRGLTDGAYLCRVMLNDGTRSVARFLVAR